MENYLWIILVIINIIGFLLMGIDKQKAKRKSWRIPEKTLWIYAIFGGGVGTTLGMYIFRHKTKHINFTIGFPLLALFQILLFQYLSTK